jgi:2',3'-cyclic-nucleotide 2'-phosphodiesterase (5'-nucleotidase family)
MEHRRMRIVVAILFALLAVTPAGAAKITFVLVNDIYQIAETLMPDGMARGGFARLAAVVKAERAKSNAVIFAHGGDTLSPSLLSGIDRGKAIVKLTNLVAPDIFAPGNHEFDFGKAVFAQRMAEATFPVFAANLHGPAGAPLPNIKDHAIVAIDGVRVGLVGATYDGTPRVSGPEDLQFSPTVETIKAQADALRREGADFIVAVMHAERQQTLALAASRAVDLILTGHSHDLFLNYDGRTAAMESSFDAHYVAIADVEIDVRERDGERRVTWWPQFRVVDTATVAPDPEVAKVVASYNDDLAKELDAPLASTATELDSRTATVRGGEAAIGSLIADAMRNTTGSDVALMNGGGIRGGRVYPSGSTITRRDVLAELPFSNRILRVTVSGAKLRQALENGLALYPRPGGRFPQISGMTVVADSTRPAGQRITSMRIGDTELDDNATYSVALTDFMTRGGDGYTQFQGAASALPENDAPLVANNVMVYLRKLGTIRNTVEGRVTWRD